MPSKVTLLAPCLHMLPHLHFGLKDKVLTINCYIQNILLVCCALSSVTVTHKKVQDMFFV
jgi:hypothetical protein